MPHSTRHRIALTTVKPLLSSKRWRLVQADTEKRAHDLDLKYPGFTFTQVLKSHGKDGRYLVLDVGPLPIFLLGRRGDV